METTQVTQTDALSNGYSSHTEPVPRVTQPTNIRPPGRRDVLHRKLGLTEEDWADWEHRENYKRAIRNGLLEIDSELKMDLNQKFGKYSPQERDLAVKKFAASFEKKKYNLGFVSAVLSLTR